ncbi:MAG: hypothetical protein HZC29_05600 [Thaumarchaeota archaeon]|nr:hypothetical protein [Nitrososphaerota archaeon]
MIPLIGIFLAVALQTSTVLVPGGTVTFYIHDDDLNTSPRGIDQISTSGLLTFHTMTNLTRLGIPRPFQNQSQQKNQLQVLMFHQRILESAKRSKSGFMIQTLIWIPELLITFH